MNENAVSHRPDYKIDISVRISDVNYGGHLGHAELIKITHQARLKFLSEFSLKEDDLDGAGIIIKELLVKYKGEAFFDDILHISIFIDKIEKASCNFLYEITKNNDQSVATVLETMLFMNYKTRRIVRVPKIMFELKEKSKLLVG